MSNILQNYLTLLEASLADLPGEKAHLEMYPMRAVTSEAIQTNDYRISAVMALIYSTQSQHRLILIERQHYNGNHSGQIGFPGGKAEPDDPDLHFTATRETYEEIGISLDSYRIAGKLSDVYIPVSKFLVHPYVGLMHGQPNFNIDPHEVRSVFDISLSDLLNPENLTRTRIQTGNGVTLKDVPAFIISDRIIWGATALMLNELRHILLRINYPVYS